MTHTHPKDNPRITNQKVTTSYLVVYISDKQDSKAWFYSAVSTVVTVVMLRAGDERLHTDRRSINNRVQISNALCISVTICE